MDAKNESQEQKRKRRSSRKPPAPHPENKPGYGNKKLEGPDRPST